nr:SCO-spondin-like protein [Pomacea canaliculata]
MSKKNKKDVQCQADCEGVEAGLYQSCQGCDHYVVCTKHGIMRLSRCPHSKVWDDKHKKCRKHSLTCKSPAGSKQDPGMS